MIRRYEFGEVLETEAILEKPEQAEGAVPYLQVDEEKRSLLYEMGEKDRVYGLGENLRGINKRGWIYESRCTDDPEHMEDKRALYGAHNFLVVDGQDQFGVFIDYPGILSFDVGYTRCNQLKIQLSDWNMDLYVITGENVRDIVRQFRRLIGRSYIPPLWAFGYGQSRWGYKSEEDVGYPVYEEGMEKGYFCKKEDGSPFVAAVWPGKALFPDMLNEEARRWFGNQYQFLLDQGIEGFWNDMNEPAIFYTEDRLRQVMEELDSYKGRNLDLDTFFSFTNLVQSLSNNTEDYKEFYHEFHGERVRHDRVHNLFGFNMTRAAGEAFERLVPER